MKTELDQLSSVAVARPMRVAYLIDLTDAPDALFDAIVAEAYSRWAGRRTLIVPAKPEGIDTRYQEWLGYFDADVIYSFVRLDDAAIADMHERYGPAHLVLHRERGLGAQERRFDIQLPLSGLSSLSVLSVFASRGWSLDGPPQNIKVLTKFWDQLESQFLQENFGFLSSSFTNSMDHPGLFSGMTLITREALDNARFKKNERATHVTSEEEVLEALASGAGPFALAQMSEWFSPYLETKENGPGGTILVAGDTAADRLLSWNAHHLFRRPSFSEITTLRLPVNRHDDDGFLGQIRSLLERRGARGHNSHNDHVSLISCSLEQAALESVAERLRKAGRWLSVRVRQLEDPSALVPRFCDPSRVSFTLGGFMAEPEIRATANFQGKLAPVPIAMPWHMKEAMPPAALRGGNWMADITIDRLNDHSRYANQRDVWKLPRRLRLERSFKLVCHNEREHDINGSFLRVMRTGSLSLALNVGIERATISIPDDFDALRTGLCNDLECFPSTAVVMIRREEGCDSPTLSTQTRAATFWVCWGYLRTCPTRLAC